MRIASGSTRIAIIGKRVTLKIPNPKIRLAVEETLESIKYGMKTARQYISQPVYADGSPRNFLFRGIVENRTEARLSKKLREVVVPTWLSLFGIVNIQATAKPHNLKDHDIVKPLRHVIGDAAFYHTFYNNENYGAHNGKLKILDYGSERAEPVLLKHHRAIRGVLDSVYPKQT